MEIHEKDFVMVPSSEGSERYDLRFYKKTKKRETNTFVEELGPPLYGLTLAHCLNKIVHHRTAKKWAEDNITLKEFIKELDKNYKELLNICKESLPENFDTGE